MVNHCVWDDIPGHIGEWAELYGHYSNSFLLLAGGITDQPEWYLKVMSAFASAHNKAHREKRDSLKD